MIRDYIIGKMSELVNKFTNAKVSYGYDAMADTHLIKVVPEEVSKKDVFYDWLNEFYLESIKNYPDEDITVFSEDEILNVENLVYEIEGEFYEEFNNAKVNLNDIIQTSINVDTSYTFVFDGLNAAPVHIDEKIDYVHNYINECQSSNSDELIYSLAA